MAQRALQIAGILWTLLYASLVIWLYAVAPRTLSEAQTSASVAAGTYEVNRARFDAALELFRREQYRAARAEWEHADPARRDARTQFYIAYAFYREGWGRVYHDDQLFREGIEVADRALALSPPGGLTVEDPELRLKTPAELKTELAQGLELSVDDLNPLKVTRERK